MGTGSQRLRQFDPGFAGGTANIAAFRQAYGIAQRRYLTISASLKEGYNVSLVASDTQKALADYPLPAGFSIEFAGENETIMESIVELLKMLLMAVAFIYLIMVAQFQSLKSPFIVLFTIPLAFTGGLLGLMLCGMEVSVKIGRAHV